MHELLVNRLGGLSLPRKSVVRLTDRPDMTLDVYRGRKTAMQQQQQQLARLQSFSVTDLMLSGIHVETDLKLRNISGCLIDLAPGNQCVTNYKHLNILSVGKNLLAVYLFSYVFCMYRNNHAFQIWVHVP